MFNRSVNKVILLGNLGKEPEMRSTANGKPVISLSLATTMGWRDKQSGEWKDKTEWHRLTVFGRLGEMCIQYLSKGARVYVEGRIETQTWKDKNSGQDRYSTNIIVNDLELLADSSKPQKNLSHQASAEVLPITKSWGTKPDLEPVVPDLDDCPF